MKGDNNRAVVLFVNLKYFVIQIDFILMGVDYIYTLALTHTRN